MKCSRFLGLAIVGLALGSIGCSPTPKTASDKATLSAESSAALTAFKGDDPSLASLMDKSVGYAVFPEVGKAGLIFGGSYGDGEVYESGKTVGYADITQASVGLQAGAQTFSELVLLLRQEDLANFKANKFSLTGNVSAVAIKAGAAAGTDTSKGVVVFVRSKGGLMAEASVGGQRFRFHPLNEPMTQPSK
jgi:lipid-binding SYLF domain-containing protein